MELYYKHTTMHLVVVYVYSTYSTYVLAEVHPSKKLNRLKLRRSITTSTYMHASRPSKEMINKQKKLMHAPCSVYNTMYTHPYAAIYEYHTLQPNKKLRS